MPDAPQAAAPCALVVFAHDLARCAPFYREVLGLELLEQEPTHQLLTGPGLELVIHQIPAGIAAAMHIERPPVLRDDTPLKPVFTVTDLARVRESATATGGGLEDEASAWTWRGHRILDGWDPEGNIVQFRVVV
jgi:predicted enzyme related to lactoylglutathione lyase